MFEMKTPRSSGNQYYVDELCPISRIPTELLVTILLLVLPDMHAVIDNRRCHEYMAHLYALRSVSKKWRGVVDGTPILWRLISSTLPPQVNATSVSRSLDAPLVVMYDMILPDESAFRGMNSSQGRQSAVSSAQSFAEWADVARHRWSSATFKLVPCVAPELLTKPAPQLRSLTIMLQGGPQAEIPPINLLGGCTEKLRHVQIGSTLLSSFFDYRIPMFWPSAEFRGLKSLHFSHIEGASFTTRYILEVLSASPELETLVLKGNIFQRDPNDTELPQVALPRLQSFHYAPNYDGDLDQTLRYVTLRPDFVKSFSVSNHSLASSYTRERCEALLATVLSPLIPVIARLHERCGGSSIALVSPTHGGTAHVSWDGRLMDPQFRFFISTISPSTVLPWVDRVLSLADPGITLSFPGNSLWGDVLGATQSMRCVDKIIVYECFPGDIPNVQRLLDTIGQVDSANPGSTSSVTFPSLHTLQVNDCLTKLDSVVGMLRTRFSRPLGKDDAGPPPDLSLNLSFRRRVRDQDYDPDNIPNLELVEGMRVMAGVKEVRLGNVTNSSGLLAVVWDEEWRMPVWG
ncbi:hypothetical protein FS837_007663 [Tulasnella sp. UAMH 9824]|nr:hypothetical protein FS837_007663 [Tulasnella sp. UAMH 9824]